MAFSSRSGSGVSLPGSASGSQNRAIIKPVRRIIDNAAMIGRLECSAGIGTAGREARWRGSQAGTIFLGGFANRRRTIGSKRVSGAVGKPAWIAFWS